MPLPGCAVSGALRTPEGRGAARPLHTRGLRRFVPRRRPRGGLGTRVLGAAAVCLLAACAQLDESVGGLLPDDEPDYKSSKRLPSLDVPPELSAQSIEDSMVIPGGGGATYSQYSTGGSRESEAPSGVLPDFEKVAVERSGNERWLVVQATPAAVWPQVRAFWLQQGFVIEVDEPGIGIMETDWAEERTQFPGGLFGRLLGGLSSALTGAASRDKFRTRIERGSSDGITEIYVSHRGAEEVAPPSRTRVQSNQQVRRVWQPRPADPGLEAEMLHRMMVFFGVQEDRARQILVLQPERPARARIVRDGAGGTVLSLDDDFARAWRRTGLALDRIGFTVEDRDRTRGLYFVRYVDPDQDLGREKGFLSGLAFWRQEEAPPPSEYLINLIGVDEATEVVVLDTGGERSAGAAADRILGLLYEQLR